MLSPMLELVQMKQALMGKSISFIPLSPALIIITLSLSWMHCPLTHICPTLNK